jgi:MFS family permease
MAEREELRPVLRRLQSANYASVFDRYTMPPSLVAISVGLEVPISQVAAAASAYFLAYGLMQPLWGMVSERAGLARTMRWAALAGSCATAASMFAQGSASLIVTRVLAGAFFGAIVPTSLI